MIGWNMAPLADVLEVQNGFAFKSALFSETTGVPLIRIRDLKRESGTAVSYAGEYDPQYLVQPGDFLIGMDGEFRCHEWGGPQALLNQRVCKLKSFSDNLMPRFLYYGINKYLKEIENRTSFTTVKHLSSKTIKSIVFPLPPLDEQRRIVAVLDEAFKGLDRARALAEANLHNAQDFLALIVEHELAASDSSWTQTTIAEVCSRFEYGTSSKSQPSGRVPVLRMGNLQGGEVDWSDLVYSDNPDDILKYELQPSDVLFNRTNSLENVGKTAIYRGEKSVIFAGYLIRL